MGKEGRWVGQKSLCSGKILVRPVGNLRAENFHWETPAWGWWSGLMSLQAQLLTWSSLGRAWPWHEHLSGSQRLATIFVLPSRFLSWRNIWAVHIHGCHSPLFGLCAPEPALPQYISRPYLISWFPFSSVHFLPLTLGQHLWRPWWLTTLWWDRALRLVQSGLSLW